MAFERAADSPRRRLRSALACARTLIDELDSLTASEPVEETSCDVVLQIADELVRIASELGSISAAEHQPEPVFPINRSGCRS